MSPQMIYYIFIPLKNVRKPECNVLYVILVQDFCPSGFRLNFLLCCAIYVGECTPSIYVAVLSTRSRMYKVILKL